MKYAAVFKTFRAGKVLLKDVMLHFETSPQNMIQLIRCKDLSQLRDLNLRDPVFAHIRIGEVRSQHLNLTGLEIKEQFEGKELAPILEVLTDMFAPVVDEVIEHMNKNLDVKEDVDSFFAKSFPGAEESEAAKAIDLEDLIAQTKYRGRRLVNKVRDILAI